MNDLQNVKWQNVTPPGAIVDNAAFNTATIDTKGFSKILLIVTLGALDIALTAMKLRESDDSGMASAVDIAKADFSVAPLALPNATADNNLYGIHVDLRGCKRYLDLNLTGGDGTTGTYATVIAGLYGASEHPSTAAERGFAAEAIV